MVEHQVDLGRGVTAADPLAEASVALVGIVEYLGHLRIARQGRGMELKSDSPGVAEDPVEGDCVSTWRS